MLTVLTQMPAFISVNRSERMPTPILKRTRTERPGEASRRRNEIPTLPMRSMAVPPALLVQLAKRIWQRSCPYSTISVGELKPSCRLRFKRQGRAGVLETAGKYLPMLKLDYG